MPFGGKTYDPVRDGSRLAFQLGEVWRLMKDGKWRTLNEISSALCFPEQSVSARLRDLRKPKFGGYLVDREYLYQGLWRYRVRRGVSDAV